MSRDDGFAVMDVSTSIHEDQKFKRLARRHPELIAPAFLAYVAIMGESWSAGTRVPIEDNWPARLIPFDRAVVAVLKRFRLLDGDGLIACDTWTHWFEPALLRQQQARERWRRANEKRHATALANLAVDSADATEVPRGNNVDTAATVPSDRTVRPYRPEIPPPPTSGGRRKDGTNRRAVGSSPRQQEANPRANGTAPKQVQEREKRGGMERLASILDRANAVGRP